MYEAKNEPMDAKARYMFDKYVEAVEKLGRNFDYKKMMPVLEKGLVKAGIVDCDGPKFLRLVWRNLENIFGQADDWNPHPDKVYAFLNSIPQTLLKIRLTDEIVCGRLQQKDWGDFRDPMWIKQQKAVSYLRQHRLHDKKPVTLIKKGQDRSFSVSVFLGDVRDKIGVQDTKTQKAYADLYDVVTAELGKEPVTARLKKIFSNENFEVINWPNLSNLDDTEYEIVFYPEDPWANCLMEDTAEEVAAEIQKLYD